MSAKLRNKPNLTIQVDSVDNEEQCDGKKILEATKSAKNIHELKKFNFNKVKTYYPNDKMVKQDKIQKLEKQKKQLLQSLQILKNGAVSAIVQKDEIITKLRKLFSQYHSGESYDKDDSKVQELQNLLQYIRDLEQQRSELKYEAERQKKIFQEEVYQREQIIQELTDQLNWSTERIDSLERYDELLQQKIKALEDNNQNLKVMLDQSQQVLKQQKRKHGEESLLLKNKSTSSINHGSDSQNGSYLNTSLRKGVGSQNDFLINLTKSLDESAIQNKLQALRNEHQIQIQDLTQFYQTRIQTLKKLCQQYPQIQYNNLINQNTSNILPVTNTSAGAGQALDNRSNHSNFTHETLQRQRLKQNEKILKKNLSLGSFKSNGNYSMGPIDEKEQIQSPKKSLKKQLMNFNIDKQSRQSRKSRISRRVITIPNQQQKSIGHSSSSSNKDKQSQRQSQFSYKYFQYPSSNFKKNKSIQSQNTSQANSPLRVEHVYQKKQVESGLHSSRSRQTNQKQIYYDYKPKQKLEEKANGSSSHFWDKFFWFTSGTITGGLLLSIGHRILK